MSTRSHQSALARYAFAIVAVWLVTWFELATWPLFSAAAYLPLTAGVVIAAIVSGPLPGIMATALGALAAAILPRAGPLLTGPQSYAPMLAFLGIGIGVSVLSVERHASRARMRRILEGVSDGCAFLGRNWRYVFVNRTAASMAGKKPEELVGAEISEVFPHVAELPALREIRRAMDEGIPGRIETYYPPLETWFETNLYPAEEGVTIIARDVTERRRSEEALRESERRLRAIFDQAIAGIAQTDEEGTFLLVNERYCEIVGRSAEELLQLRIQDITHPDDVSRNEAHLANGTAAGENFVTEERYRRPNGTHVWVRKQFSSVRATDGSPRYGFSIVEEITERKRAEADKDEALRRERLARSEAETANRSKDEFLAVVSHELRTPLTAMLGWLRLMRMGAVDASATSRGLETVERNANSLVRLVEDLLDVSRIITGKLELDVRSVPVAPIVRAALDVIRPAAEAKQIDLRARLDPDPGVVSADPARLQQVVWNLLANATKFTPRGGRVEISATRKDDHVAIAVTDTGAGIGREFLPRVFERFRQADSSQSRKHSGLGLGLAIVRHVIEMHGGTVQAESKGEGRGAKFIVTIPIRSALAPRSVASIAPRRTESPGAAAPPPAEPVPLLNATRVLVVEDEADTRTVLARILTWRGAEVRTCSSAAEARSTLRSWMPDVLVSDIGMPGESGYSLIASVRSTEREAGGHVPAIALTAYAREENRLQALSAGYDLHVAKPIEPAELIRAVAKLHTSTRETVPRGQGGWKKGPPRGPGGSPNGGHGGNGGNSGSGGHGGNGGNGRNGGHGGSGEAGTNGGAR